MHIEEIKDLSKRQFELILSLIDNGRSTDDEEVMGALTATEIAELIDSYSLILGYLMDVLSAGDRAVFQKLVDAMTLTLIEKRDVVHSNGVK